MKHRQINLKLNTERSKKIKKGRAEFHKLGQLLKRQLDEEKERNMKYKH